MGTGAAAQGRDGFAGRRMHRRQIVAVDRSCRHAVGAREGTHVLYVRVFFAARELRIPVILTYEQKGKLPQHREVEGFVENARSRGTVAEEDDADRGLASALKGPRCAGGKG